ncbi:hypothetical protein G8A07_22360 [Roseateles sp. DAIF2]|uniref:YqcI/YcgG family protein n=1 Tax=Roseateles sp. DAIF2 TaxID=2714952 RepID=UPI0018A2ECA3|nr:YqcI/YcgG family protein [Roseateles sp. DAIF2]QPF75391.1 hypothetical protein G8A07_22360 [Roseateles sp. DAIF2]
MNAILDDLRQPTCTEALSPAMQRYLFERVAAVAQRALDAACPMHLYQCLGDPGSARTLAQDLHAFAAQNQAGSFIAVFECPSPCNEGDGQSFAATLDHHLGLMRQADAGIGPLQRRDKGLDGDDFRLSILGREFSLIALHAEAGRLSRVLPCPVLLVQPTH